MGKYKPLSQLLASLGEAKAELSFGQIERILGSKLPKKAGEDEVWWGALVRLQAGWRIENVRLSERKVTFGRVAASVPQAKSGRPDPWGCMAGTVTIMPDTDLTAPTG